MQHLAVRKISEERGTERLAQVEADDSARSLNSTNTQLAALRNYYAQGVIGAEQLHNKERELITSQSSLKKQLAEKEIAAQEAVYARFLADLEQANAAVAAAIDESQTNRDTNAKTLQLDLMRRGGDQKAGELVAAQSTNDAGIIAAENRIELNKTELL